jgi:sulfate permease, SulP family
MPSAIGDDCRDFLSVCSDKLRDGTTRNAGFLIGTRLDLRCLPFVPNSPKEPEMSFGARLRFFLNPVDGRYEDLKGPRWYLGVFRDFTAGLIVAMVAIPLAMGFAMASGLRPEQGIVGGAVAGLVGALFGGSKYQVYGPTAAFIPIIFAITSQHDHAFLVLCSIVAGVILMVLGLARAGRIVQKVPHSIVVGFTIGIAFTIAMSQAGEVFGLRVSLPKSFIPAVKMIAAHFHELNPYAVLLALLTFVITKSLLKVTVYVPAPLISVGIGTVIANTAWKAHGLVLVKDKFGEIPRKLLKMTGPAAMSWDARFVFDLVYFALAIVFVAAIESLLCSRMADRLANNKGQPFSANKELWGQGLVNILVPLFNGFPHTGALARTATNIKLGAMSPLAGIFKFALKLLLAAFMAKYLELVPMACIGGILAYVASNMVKKEEVREVLDHDKFHIALMAYTAGAVILTDFLRGVLSALAIYVVLRKFFERDAPHELEPEPIRPGVRAVLGRDRGRARSPQHAMPAPSSASKWLRHVSDQPHIPKSSFVHPQASIIGRVVLGDHVHVAADTSVRADEGSPFFIGSNSNVQDGVVMHALKDKHVLVRGEPWAIYVGSNVSMAHDALVHGPCYIGDDTFVGFKAVVHDSVVGSHCFIGIGAVVVGVEIPDGKFVPHGSIIDSKEKVAALPDASDSHSEFNEDVVDVNRGLAAAYHSHQRAGHGVAVLGTHPARESMPRTVRPRTRAVEIERF